MISWICHQRQTQQKKKIDKLVFMKIKNFRASKGINHGVKSQHIEWEKISVNHISGKGFISRIQLQLNNKNCYSKMSKELELLFLQKRYTNSQNQMQHCLLT